MNQKIKNFLTCTGIFMLVMAVMLVAAGFMKRSLNTDGSGNQIVAEGSELSNTDSSTADPENPDSLTDPNEQGTTGETKEDAQQQQTDEEANSLTEEDALEEAAEEETAASSDSETLAMEETDANTEKAIKVIAIDAGHQLNGNPEKEPNGPGSTVMKAKVTSGATGVSSKVPEYVLTLEVSKKLKEVLLERGYEVVMIRETHDVNLSNAERAEIANESADLFIRIHANGADDANVSGALTIYPSKDNEYVAYMSEACQKLSEEVVNGLCAATGAKNRGASAMDNMSGINWCTIPVTIVEMGYLSNPTEDELMQQDAYQDKIAKGIADGIDAYVSGQ